MTDTTTNSVPQGSATSGHRLECTGVTVRFGGLVAVRDVDLAVPPGRIVGLVGPNGAGKSTLFGVLSGLLTPTTGKVYMHGQEVTDARPQVRATLGLARTFQHPELFSGLTVRQHLSLAYRVRNAKRRVWSDLFTLGSLKRPAEDEKSRVDELIDVLAMGSLADRSALGLPLGSARLVELGRALASAPSVLLLDEPSSGLDSTESEQFERTLTRVADEWGISILLVEHDVEMVMRLCSEVYVLDFGALIAHGTPAEVQANPAVRAAYLGEEVETAKPEPEAEVAEVEAALAQSSLAHLPAPAPDGSPAPGGAESLVIEDLAVRYGDALALSGVSVEVPPGRVLAVLGPNGAGKSSLARAVSGLVRPHSGRVLLGGHDMAKWPADRIRNAGLLHLPEGRGVFRSMSVIDNLRMAAASVEGRQARKEALARALEIFPVLAARRRQVAGSLSGGEQQMLSLARGLATNPKLIVADEMSLGLAPMMVDLVFEGLDRARAAGSSVIMIEQYVHRALAFADDCLILQRGTVAWYGPANKAGTEVLGHYLGEAMTAAS
ncbi:MAG: ATP-binding cassette domain-containing protein [Actinomycetota bacterium]|nr:ATP-binding cassette domain-containing protein [Actinomycetota bacterium]